MSLPARVLAASLLVLAAVVLLRVLRPELSGPPPLPVLDTLGGEFALPGTAHAGDTALAEFRGRVVLLNFGFTSCPDVCPTVLSRMRQLLLDLGEDAADVQAIFVTLDPERDTLERLGPYVRHFHPAMVGLRGTQEQTVAVAARYKVLVERVPQPPPMDYGFSHSDHIYLLDRQGRVRATFGNGRTREQMLADVRRLLDEPQEAP